MSKSITVLVTRPAQQAQSWLQALQSAGWQAESFPTLVIAPLPLLPQDKDKVLNLDQYQGVICVSSNAAEIGLELLSDYWPQWPMRQDWYAVGQATAEAMAQWHIRPRIPSGHHSEGLLDMAGLQQVAEQRFLLLKGQGGRDAIQTTLRARGAGVDELVLYERRCPVADLGVLQRWFDKPGDHYVAVSSGDGLKNLLTMVPDYVSRIKQLPLIVVSQRLADYAQQRGFERVIVAKGASGEAIATALAQHIKG